MTRSTAASTTRRRSTSPSPGTFLSNFEPLTREQAQGWSITWSRSSTSITEPMKRLVGGFRTIGENGDFVVSSAHPRLVDGKPSKNPRYLQRTAGSVESAAMPISRRSARGWIAAFPPANRCCSR